MKLYLAISKLSGNVMCGNHGQYAYSSPATLKKSIGQAYGWQAKQKGVKPMDLYTIISVDVEDLKKIGEEYK